MYTGIYTGKKYGIFFIKANFCIFLECEGCFCTWNTFIPADINLGVGGWVGGGGGVVGWWWGGGGGVGGGGGGGLIST